MFSTGDIQVALDEGVPRSTARGWARRPPRPIVTVEPLELDANELRLELIKLRAQNQKLSALLRLLVVLARVSGITLAYRRLPDGRKKRCVLDAIDQARTPLSMKTILRVVGLSSRRYHDWRREEACGLDDVSSCPRTSPHQLTPEEVRVVRTMVTSEEYRHVPTGTLALLAQRLGRIFASPSTWYRLVRLHQWRRPRRRLHPAKPKVGIRATQPNEIWHVDTSIIRLLDGTRAYLTAVIDNFSRRILAWNVTDRFDVTCTATVLNAATMEMENIPNTPTVLTDGGPENRSSGVDDLISSGRLRRLLAMTEIIYSNSMIESFFRAIKHQWLFLNTLDSVSKVRKLVSFYVEEHNTRLPHSAFHGQTPDEVYYRTGDDIPEELDAARSEARQARKDWNRNASCKTCSEEREEVAAAS